jgi:hypothetical protein
VDFPATLLVNVLSADPLPIRRFYQLIGLT